MLYTTGDGEQVDQWLPMVNPHEIVWVDDEDACMADGRREVDQGVGGEREGVSIVVLF